MSSNSNWISPEEMGVSPLPEHLTGLETLFPSNLFLLHNSCIDQFIVIDAYPVNTSHREALKNGFQGLACYQTFEAAVQIAETLSDLGVTGFEPIFTSFEDARYIAIQKLTGMGGLVLMDHAGAPLVHHIR